MQLKRKRFGNMKETVYRCGMKSIFNNTVVVNIQIDSV